MDLANLFATNRFHEIIVYFESQDNYNYGDHPLETQFLAASFFKSGEYQKAFNLLEILESALYNDPDYLSLFGATCRRLTLYSKAKDLFLKAIQLRPDSIQLKNNFSNLLIDLDNIDEAISILKPIVASHPDYADAQVNLNRALFIQDNHTQSLSSEKVVSFPSSSSFIDPLGLFDPLTNAFSDEEVQQYGRIKQKMKAATLDKGEKIDLPSLPADSTSSEYMALAKQAITDKNFQLALELCSKVNSQSSPTALTFSIASDALIQLRRFLEAEVSLLTSILLSEPTSVQYINLSTLASLRKDVNLASIYLDRAASLDPSNPSLSKVRSNLKKVSKSHPYFDFNASWSASSVI